MIKGNAKAVYWIVFAVTYSLLSLLFMASLRLAEQQFFGKGSLGGYGGTLAVPFMVVSAIVANTICRRLGISKDSRVIEVLNRNLVTPLDAPVKYEIRYSAAIWRSLTYIMAIFTLVLTFILVFLPIKPGTDKMNCLVCGVFCAITICCWLLHHFNWTFIGEANELGVKGYHRAGLRPRFVAWENIQSCEVLKVRDVTGNPSYPLFLFKDGEGKVLLSMTTWSAAAGQASLFKDVVQSHLAQRETVPASANSQGESLMLQFEL